MGKRNLPLSYNEINKTKPKKKTVMVKMVTMQSGMIEKFVFFFFCCRSRKLSMDGVHDNASETENEI